MGKYVTILCTVLSTLLDNNHSKFILLLDIKF